MWKAAKEFSDESNLKYPSSFIFNNKSTTSAAYDNEDNSKFKSKMKELKNILKKKKIMSDMENQNIPKNINNSNNNTINNLSHNNNNESQFDGFDVINNINQENNLGNENIQNIPNIQNQDLFIQGQSTNIGNQTTKRITGTNLFITMHPNSEEEQNEEEGKIQKVDNKKKNQEYKYRNVPISFVKNFFKDLVKFINILIMNFNKENNRKIELLELINGNNYIHYNLINALNLLDFKAVEALSVRKSLVIKKKKTVLTEKELPNSKKVLSIYKETKKNRKIYEVIFVLDMTIRDLMKIYTNKEIPDEDFFKYFNRFDNYIKSLKKKNKKEKKIIKEIAEKYEENLKRKINDNSYKIGPKPGYLKEN